MNEIYKSPYYQEFSDAKHFCLNDKYKEIIRLHEMLAENDIPHVIRRWLDGWMVCYPVARPLENCVMDAIEITGSYGASEGKLEIQGLLTPWEEAHDSVVGYLTAVYVFERIKKHWEENGEKHG